MSANDAQSDQNDHGHGHGAGENDDDHGAVAEFDEATRLLGTTLMLRLAV